MTEEKPSIMIDLRALAQEDLHYIESLVLAALFDTARNHRDEAIAELQEEFPNIIGGYCSNNRIILLMQVDIKKSYGFLGDVPFDHRKRESHPWKDGC